MPDDFDLDAPPARPITGPQSGVYGSSMTGAKPTDGGNVALKLSYEPVGTSDVIRVNCEGQLSLRGRPYGADPLVELLGPRAHSYAMILSLAKVTGVETSGLAWFVQTGERVAAAGGRMVVTHMSPMVSAPLEMLQVQLPFRVAVTEAEALAAAAGN